MDSVVILQSQFGDGRTDRVSNMSLWDASASKKKQQWRRHFYCSSFPFLAASLFQLCISTKKSFSSFRPHAYHHHNHALPPPPPLHPYHLYPCPQVEQEQNYYLRVERGAFSFMKQSSLCRRQNWFDYRKPLLVETSSQAPSYASPKLWPTDSLTHWRGWSVELLA